jgi:hypothetical protein
MRLYEYNKRFAQYLEEPQFDEITGELLPPDFEMQKDEALNSYIAWVKNETAFVEAIDKEKAILDEKKKRALKNIEFAKKQLSEALDGKKYKSAVGNVSFRKSASIDVYDASKLDAGYLRVKTEPDKKAIKEAIMQGGEVAGACLKENVSVIVK